MEILIILALVVLNGAFAMSEIAVVSARKALLRQRAEGGDTQAQAALDLAETPNRFLSTVQIGISLIGVLAGAFGGATTAQRLSAWWVSVAPPLEPYAETLSFALVVVFITYLSLVIGELVPKRLAMQAPEAIASRIALPMTLLSRVAAPLVSLLSISTNLVLRVFGANNTPPIGVTEAEVRAMILEGTESGVFDVEEHEMVEAVFELDDQHIGSLMTPRIEVVWLDMADSSSEIRQKIAASRHTRFPVCDGDLDNIVGFVHVRDLLLEQLHDAEINLRKVMREPLFVPESLLVSRMLERFRRDGQKFAIVMDEYGGVQGVITVNDIMEEIVGDIDLEDPRAVQRNDGSWLLDGMLPIDDFKTLFDIDVLPEEEARYYHTISGFVMMHQGHIPKTAETFEWNGLRFEVMDMDGNRIDKVLVTRATETPNQEREQE